MKLFATILFVLFSLTGISQIDFDSDFNKTKLFPELIPKIKLLNKNFDFQLRFWQHEGMVFPATRRLFTMTSKKGKWNCKCFDIKLKYIGEQNRVKVIKKRNNGENCDSIWSYFIENNILSLPNMDQFKKDFYTIIKPVIKEPVFLLKEIEDKLKTGNCIEEVTVIGSGVWKRRIVVADGVTYSLEFFKANKYKRIEYYCPIHFAKEYKHIPELQYFSNILRYINKIWE